MMVSVGGILENQKREYIDLIRNFVMKIWRGCENEVPSLVFFCSRQTLLSVTPPSTTFHWLMAREALS